MKKLFFKLFSLILTVLIIFGSVNCSLLVFATDIEAKDKEPLEMYYWELLEEYKNSDYKDYNGKDIQLSIKDAICNSAELKFSDKEGKEALIWIESIEEISWEVSIPQSALYSIELDYYAINSKSTDIQRSLLIDGELPCMEWNNLVFSRLFKDKNEKRVDVNGDESSPNMEQIYQWQTTKVSDYNGYFSSPMKVYISEGKHILTLKMNGNQPMAMGGLRFVSPENILPYSEVEKIYKQKGYKPSNESFECEAENTLSRSSSSLRLVSDSDLSCSPNSLSNKVINSVGGSSWKNSRQTITWELNVPEDGIYQIGFDYYTYYNYGLPVYRRITIDGKVPFEELSNYCFKPSTKWQNKSLSGNDGLPYSFYLTKGKHTLSMSIVSGKMTDVIEILTSDMDVLSALYLDITLITTSDPDPNYDYNLSAKIPGLIDTMNQLYDNLEHCANIIKEECGNDKALNYSLIINAMEDLKILMEDEFEIPSNIDQFTTLLSSYGNWISQIKAGTMTLDKIMLLPPKESLVKEKVTWHKKLASFIISFIKTFSNDYNTVIGDGEFDKSSPIIDVWFGGTQIWANEIQEIIESDFVKNTGIQVKFRLTPDGQISTGVNAMLLALLSDTAPDVVLSAPSIADYAMRNQVYDLTQFEDYEQIAKRFPEVCMTPLTYKGKVYGLPLTMNVQMMFYRKDIFKKINIKVPQTWDDVIDKVIPKLSENSMHLSSSPGYGILLYQMNGEIYNEEMTETLVASQESWEAFKKHCDFYNMYGVPKNSNFFNRFRSGESPIGFGNLGTYIQFIYAAPELSGRWGIAPMPGTVQSDGSINRNIGGLLGQASMMLADAKHPKEGWEFLKWYTEADTQLLVSERMEAKLDMSARHFSANVEAFEALDWNIDDLKVFRESMEQTKAYNPVLGSYQVDRYIGLAFNYVVFDKSMTEREALEFAEKNINRELERRRKGLS